MMKGDMFHASYQGVPCAVTEGLHRVQAKHVLITCPALSHLMASRVLFRQSLAGASQLQVC